MNRSNNRARSRRTRLHVDTVLVRSPDWSALVPEQTYCRKQSRDARRTAPIARNRVLIGDALQRLRRLPAASVDCAITSPPYFLLRNYQAEGQLGLEATVDGYVEHVGAVCDELARVLKPSGSLWLNLGDSYSRHPRYGASAKNLLLAPERILLALAERSWIVRNKVVWSKPNPMPTSVRDRLNTTWEPIYLLVRSPHYFFDLDAIREPHRTKPRSRNVTRGKYELHQERWAGPLAGANDGLMRVRAAGRVGHPKGKNPGDVWSIATAGYRGAHFATFPVQLVAKPMLATCPERVCEICGIAWGRAATGLQSACTCGAPWRPGLVLDPFMGAGTVAVAAESLGRDWLGIELNPDYATLAMERIEEARAARGAREGATDVEMPMAA
jgi:DNA modification methylase